MSVGASTDTAQSPTARRRVSMRSFGNPNHHDDPASRIFVALLALLDPGEKGLLAHRRGDMNVHLAAPDWRKAKQGTVYDRLCVLSKVSGKPALARGA
jgi:hypothetical protein